MGIFFVGKEEWLIYTKFMGPSVRIKLVSQLVSPLSRFFVNVVSAHSKSLSLSIQI